MQIQKRYRWLAIGALLIPSASRAQGPQPTVREIATLPGAQIGGAIRMPNGRIVIYTMGNRILAYDPATKRSTEVVTGFDGELSVSPAGDRIAYSRNSPEEDTDRIWSIPIDPNTGAATGPAQRISMSYGDTPSFSPDGKVVAFAKYAGKGNDLTVVSPQGGPERIVASFPHNIFGISWSRDGKWIFPLVSGAGSVLRVPADGGTPEPGFPVSRPVGVLDGILALYPPDDDAQRVGRLAYATISGARGEFRIPPGARWRGDNGGQRSERILVTEVTRPEWALSISLSDGRVRELRPESFRSRGPAWSPDGKRIVVNDSIGGAFGITVMDADGSRARHYPVNTLPVFMRWSPNGQMVTYAPARQPGRPQELAVLDLASGASQVVSSSPGANWQDYRWSSDGKSLVVFKTFPAERGPGSGPLVRQLFEAPLGGSERMVRDVGAELPALTRVGLFGAGIIGMGSSSDHVLIPTKGGAPVMLPRGRNWIREPGISRDGRWLSALVGDPDGRITSVDLVATTGDSVRTLRVPFEVGSSTFCPPFTPDGRNLILFGKMPGDSVTRIFSVPVDGSAPRALAVLPLDRFIAGRLDLSPDGRTVVVTAQGTPTSKIHELDLTPIYKTIGTP